MLFEDGQLMQLLVPHIDGSYGVQSRQKPAARGSFR